jgi:hypothetical protein
MEHQDFLKNKVIYWKEKRKPICSGQSQAGKKF